jgi:hypothetical protein
MAKRNGIVNELLDSQTQRYDAHEIKPQSAHALALARALAAALKADGAG